MNNLQLMLYLLVIRNKASMSTLMNFIQCFTGSFSVISQEKRIKDIHPDYKGRSKTLYLQNVIICVENSKSLQKSEFTQIVGYKGNI